MIVHACDKEWMNKDAVVESVTKLFKNYNATIDLKGGSEKVPLEKAFKNVLTNFSTCLRDRTYNDVNAIIKISKVVLPDFKFERNSINRGRL